jgi:AAA+ superfamily predicted ATPase
MSAHQHHELNLPKGIHRIRPLPDPALGGLWNSIILDESIKSQLLSQALLNKTSLARGLAHRTAESFMGSKFRLLEVEPHTLTSAAMGKTQRAVSELFSQSIAESATGGPVIVLLDEVETLAADRFKMSMEANPIDVHRATDAVLVQLDLLAEQNPQLLFVATSNFPQAVDSAFTSRCDLIMHIPR